MKKYSLPKPLLELADSLATTPGIGPKMANRLAVYWATKGSTAAGNIQASLQQLQSEVNICEQCGNLTDGELCSICKDENRDRTQLMVVESSTDLLQVEQGDVYTGLYIVLGGLISPVNGIGPADLRISEVERMLDRHNVEEVILALSSNVEAEATSLYIAERLQKTHPHISITRLARGLPTGVDIEYLDQETISGALQGRKSII